MASGGHHRCHSWNVLQKGQYREGSWGTGGKGEQGIVQRMRRCKLRGLVQSRGSGEGGKLKGAVRHKGWGRGQSTGSRGKLKGAARHKGFACLGVQGVWWGGRRGGEGIAEADSVGR